MPLKYVTGTTTQRVEVAPFTGTSFSMALWIYPFSLANNLNMCFHEGVLGGGTRTAFRFSLASVNGDLGVSWNGVTGQFYTSSTGIITANKWQFTAADIVANTSGHIFVGDQLTPCTEVSYASSNNGATANALTNHFQIGNRYVASAGTDQPFDGVIAMCALYSRVLALDEYRQIQEGRVVVPSLLGLWFPGREGAVSCFDHSGNNNHGTVFTAKPISDNVPPVLHQFLRRVNRMVA